MLETLRADKTIGTSLEAHVQIKRSKENAELEKNFSLDELADILIVSKFEWVDELTLSRTFKDDETGYELAGAFVSGTKCPRCWKYDDNPNEHGLCKRCAHVLHEE